VSECSTDVVATWYDVLTVAAANGHVLGAREGGEDGPDDDWAATCQHERCGALAHGRVEVGPFCVQDVRVPCPTYGDDERGVLMDVSGKEG